MPLPPLTTSAAIHHSARTSDVRARVGTLDPSRVFLEFGELYRTDGHFHSSTASGGVPDVLVFWGRAMVVLLAALTDEQLGDALAELGKMTTTGDGPAGEAAAAVGREIARRGVPTEADGPTPAPGIRGRLLAKHGVALASDGGPG